TERVARAMAEVMGAKLALPEDVSPASLAEYDLVGFGSGIYFMRHHKTIRALVDRLPATSKDAFVFSTSGDPRNLNGALVRQLEKKSFRIRGSFACTGWDTFGPYKLVGGLQKGHPDEKDLENARAFARGLVKQG
ncbi:MAG TPA: flavodoxin family protein, partial [Methanocella sp.]|nr:flavodoxin family protein [Methanocella sp.]